MNRGIGLEREWPDACKTREQTFEQQMRLFQPDIVVLAGGMWDVTDRKLQGSTTWTHIGDPAYDGYLTGEFEHLIGRRRRRLGGALVKVRQHGVHLVSAPRLAGSGSSGLCGIWRFGGRLGRVVVGNDSPDRGENLLHRGLLGLRRLRHHRFPVNPRRRHARITGANTPPRFAKYRMAKVERKQLSVDRAFSAVRRFRAF